MIDGVYDVDTRDAVYAFQRDYGLIPTGVIDETTWNKIVNAYYYVLANAEVSEPYPGEPIARGSQGASVLFIQTALNAVNQHVPEIPSVADDGIFGRRNRKSRKSFPKLLRTHCRRYRRTRNLAAAGAGNGHKPRIGRKR